jgi:hypothetical protein
MNRQKSSILLGVCTVAVSALVVSCGDSNVETVQKGQQSSPPPTQQTAKAPASNSAAGTTASAAGLSWSIPEGWDIMGPRPMRAATYMIGEGDNSSECAVFFFGTGQGGDVQSNIDRWIGQFQQPDGSDSKAKATTEHRHVGDLHADVIDLTGTYMSGGMGGQPTVPKTGYRLLGAIVDAPEGPLFFKLTGPAAAVEEIKPHFDNLVASLKKS